MNRFPGTAIWAAVVSGVSVICLTLVSSHGAAGEPGATAEGKDPLIERGRYITLVSGCNDCHTEGFIETNGQIPESEWLMGSRLGWSGPWGTTYASNLRLFYRDMTEAQWLEIARRLESRPPMPWFTLREMTDEDLKAIYRFTRSLGDPGEPAPAWLPPGEKPEGPHFRLSGLPSE